MMADDPAAPSERLNAELKRRLEEAEDTIRAIRDGEVDALVMRNPSQQDEVFTLEGGTESYRAFMEAMDIGGAAVDTSGRVLYANKALCDLVGIDAQNADQSSIFAGLPASAQTVLREVIDRARLRKATAEMVFAQNGEEKHVQISAGPLSLGVSQGVAITFTDITSRIRELAAQESERMALAIIASANEAVVVCDANGIVTHANAAVRAITRDDPVGRPFEDAIPIVVPDATGLMQVSEFVARATAGRPVQGIEAFAPQAPKVRDLLISAAPLRVGGMKTAGCVVTMVDLSQRKAAEKQQLLLMGELDHRVKNTLALVLSIAKRTASTEETVDGFQIAFSNRIQALAATHNILAERSWSSIPVRDVVLTELEPYISDLPGRLVIEGLDVRILPRAAIALGLILHELATNAVKYGALTTAEGKVRLTLLREAGHPGIIVEWKEQGGPLVLPPRRKGFGQTVITKSMQFSVDGGADLDFAEDGVHCRIRVPSSDIVDAALD